MSSKRAVSIVTYNRSRRLGEVVEGVLSTVPGGTDVFVCDDGSRDATAEVMQRFPKVGYYRGPNKGVGANKNRALFLMQKHHFSCIIEDDLVPQSQGWFEIYETVATMTDIHHFCRVQDKEVPETHPVFSAYLKEAMGLTPVYGPSPRGDLTFITRKVITAVGGLHPLFEGVGYAHGEWSDRVIKAGLVSHPSKWVDIREARDMFKQRGDTEGGRWNDDEATIRSQITRNKMVRKKLTKEGNIYCPLELR